VVVAVVGGAGWHPLGRDRCRRWAVECEMLCRWVTRRWAGGGVGGVCWG